MSRACLLLSLLGVVVMLSISGAAPARAEGDSTTNWGLGLGIPYGVLGVNLESGAQTRLSVGAGSALVGLGWNVGVKHYFKPLTPEQGSASVSLYYGVNGVAFHDIGDDETLRGFSIGAGWTKGHFDVGLMVPFSEDPEERPGEDLEEWGPAVKLYIGYRF